MLVSSRAFFAFAADTTSPEKFYTSLIKTFFMFENVERGYLEIEFFMYGVLAYEQVIDLIKVFYYRSHDSLYVQSNLIQLKI